MAPCASTPSPPSSSKKLLISKLKPLPEPAHRRFPQNSNEKRSRDLPNLSDCHCCGGRINYTNPKERLQPMDSLWRIVLLCRKCRKNLRLQQVCSYCFGKTGDSDDSFVCGACRRRIHKDCVGKYGGFAPWCYLRLESNGCSVCVDCWVPHVLRNSLGGEGKGLLKDNNEEPRGFLQKVEKKVKFMVKEVKKSSSRSLKDNFSSNADSSKKIVENEQGVDVNRLRFGLRTYVKDRNRKVWKPAAVFPECSGPDPELNPDTSMEASDQAEPWEDDLPVEFDRFEKCFVTYKRSRFKLRDQMV